MKKFLTNNTAFSLIELIITSALVVIVLLGIFGINTVLSNNGQDYGQRYLLKSETQATLNHIVNNASLAIGSAGANQAIVFTGQGMLPADADSFCIHQNISHGPYAGATTIDNSPSLNTPGITTNDRWLCYTWYPSSNVTYPNEIVYCAINYNFAGGPVACSTANVTASGGNANNGPFYLGTANTNPTVTFSTTTLLFSVSITNYLNNAVATDPVTNPQQTLTGSASPSQVGP